jgi:hypothetical protein
MMNATANDSMTDLTILRQADWIPKILLSAALASLLLWPKYLTLGSAGARISPFNLVILLCLVVISFKTLVGSSRSGRHRRPVMVLLTFIVWWVFRVLSDIFGLDPTMSLYATMREFTYGGSLFLIAFVFCRNDRHVARLANLICWCTIPLAGIGLVEAVLQQQFPALLRSIMPIDIDPNFAATLVFDKSRDGVFRSQSVFFHPIVYGMFMSALLPIAIWQTFNCSRGYLGLIAIGCCVLGVIFCGSRSAQIALIVSAFGYFGFFVFKDGNGNIRWGALLAIPVVVILVFFAFDYIRELATGRTEGEVGSSLMRTLMWERGSAPLDERPLFGYGDGSDLQLAGIYSNRTHTWTIDDYYLSVLLNFGYIGLLALFAIPATLIRHALRAGQESKTKNMVHLWWALFVGMLVILVAQKATSIVEGMALFYFFGGVIASRDLTRNPFAGVCNRSNPQEGSAARQGFPRTKWPNSGSRRLKRRRF